ncbi:MAG TPA: anhydro-N-acetylmuramic acid kinase [Leptolyngbyaceae cyanobacterium M33_DOE_097]|uniref:Anhydro-N-acetylmuramic acid kinase n=1 Tax=Oscillatoriales cyanobacterium SpSt-418 TaxID=2282169 RepID=A0A7C3PG45_9CYAN|nr:anhydro-N-acetylmuramic acid kinase [Leptolyngbyaceae cyanobacterium M33_DOE_097]
MTYVIGLISGTSVDGIDAALVEISGSGYDLQVNLLAGETYPYPAPLREQILAVCGGAALSIAELAELDDAIAQVFAQAVAQIQVGQPVARLIGSHGQTVFHRPPAEHSPTASPAQENTVDLGYTVQLGRGALIAYLTGITTVSNFRAADIATGGHGAPMVPPIDVALLSHPTEYRCVQNIGGIGNVAYLLPKQKIEALIGSDSSKADLPILGWDTGPGNVLIDLAVQHFSQGQQTYDRDGAWAASGTPNAELVNTWLQQAFFHLPPPKSTGRELFGVEYLEQCLADAEPYNLSEADFLATLTDLTAASIALNYREFLPQLPAEVLVGGGGSKNPYLLQRIQHFLPETQVMTTDAVGLNADFKEAIAFAVLAYWRWQGFPGNLPRVTGAKRRVLLGEIYDSPTNPVIA